MPPSTPDDPNLAEVPRLICLAALLVALLAIRPVRPRRAAAAARGRRLRPRRRSTGAQPGARRGARRLQRERRLVRPDQPDGDPLRARRARLRRREVRPHPHLRLRRATRRRPSYADLRTQVHDFWDRGLLGLALDPGFDSGRPYVYVAVHVQQGPALARHAALAGRLPVASGRDRPRLRRHRPALRAHRRQRAGAARGLVPAVPEPLRRRPRLRLRRRAVRQRRRRRELQLGRLRPGGRQPVRRPARTRAVRCAPRTCARAATRRARRRRPAAGPGHGRRRCPDNPGTGDANAAPDRRDRLPQPVPDDHEAGHERPLRGRRRLEHVGGDQPHPHAHGPRAQHGLAVLRGLLPPVGVRRARPVALRVAVRRRRRQVVPAAGLQPRRQGRRGRVVPDGRLLDLRARVRRRRATSRPSTRAPCSSRTTRAAASG